MGFKILILYVFVTFPAASQSQKCNKTTEGCLIDKLLTDYSPAVRPARQPSDTVTVKIHLTTLHVVDLNEKDQILETSGWLTQTWHDTQLMWKPDDYGGLKMIRLPAERIWRPDIVVTNSVADSNLFTSAHVHLVTAMNDGTVQYSPHSRLKTDCKLDVTHFPHDTQVCQIILGSWTYDLSKIDIQLMDSTPENYTAETKEWDIIKFYAKRKVLKYGAETTQQASLVQYFITLARKSLYLKQMYSIPHFALAAIITCQFLIPPVAAERIIVGIGSIIAELILLIIMETHLPREMSDIPSPALYVFFLLVLSAAGVVMTVIVLNMYHRDIRRGKVPPILRKIFLGYIRWMVCMSRDTYSALPLGELEPSFDTRRDSVDLYNRPESTAAAGDTKQATEKLLEEIRDYLKACATKRNEAAPSHRELIINEWRQLAFVLDRTVFFVYIVMILVATIIIYSR